VITSKGAGGTRCLACAAGFLIAAAVVPPAYALEEDQDVWSFFVGGSISYDDNFLRLPNDVQPDQVGVGDRPRGTWIYNAYARVLMDVPVSRQRFRVDLTGFTNRYADYSYLDFSGWNGRAEWLWEAGNRWKGVAFIARTEALTSFADFRDFNTGNILTASTAYVDADYWIHPNWRIVGAVNYLQGRNSQDVLAFDNIDQYSVEAGFRYVSTAQNWLRPTVRYTRGDYPNRPLATLLSDTGFDQYDVGVDLSWRFTGVSEINGRVAYTERKLPILTERNFSGPTGRLTYNWTPRGTVGVSFLALREIGAITDITATYIVTSTLGVTPYWLVTPKVRLEASYNWTDRDYAGQPAVLGIPQRNDQYNFARLTANWVPTRNWTVTLGYQYSDRTSNFPGLQFDDNTYTLTAQFGW
jgi:exopolysaccharide biosynthesis operon protein EpsL